MDADGADEPGDTALVGPRETIGSPSGEWALTWARPRHRMLRVLPPRYRKLVGAVALAGLAATVGNAFAAQAAQRQAERSSVSVLDAAYAPSEDGQTLNLLVELTDSGPHPVTVISAQATQADLTLDYLGADMDLVRTEQLQIVLFGAYDCSANARSSAIASKPDAATGVLHMTVRNVQGNVSTIDVPLPASARLPDRFAGGRAAYCGLSLNS